MCDEVDLEVTEVHKSVGSVVLHAGLNGRAWGLWRTSAREANGGALVSGTCPWFAVAQVIVRCREGLRKCCGSQRYGEIMSGVLVHRCIAAHRGTDLDEVLATGTGTAGYT